MIFRVYIESLWYPGRNLNVMNVIQTTPLRGHDSNGNLASSAGGAGGDAAHSSSGALTTPVKRMQTDNNLPVDKVEPPKIITGRHVAAVFEKLGYDPASGQKVFSLLFEAVARLKTNDSTSDKLPKTPNSRFNNSAGATRTPGIAEEEDGSRGSSEEEISPQTTATGASTPVAPTPSHQQKMDYADFAKAIEIDDIFLQVGGIVCLQLALYLIPLVGYFQKTTKQVDQCSSTSLRQQLRCSGGSCSDCRGSGQKQSCLQCSD